MDQNRMEAVRRNVSSSTFRSHRMMGMMRMAHADAR